MHARTTACTAILALAVLTAGCSSSEGKTDTTPSASGISSKPVYTQADCLALLEKNYQANAMRDASHDPECAALSRDDYTQVVGQVMANHKDDILDDATNEVIWGQAWDEMDADAQTRICIALQADDPAVGETLTQEQAQYYLDNKC